MGSADPDTEKVIWGQQIRIQESYMGSANPDPEKVIWGERIRIRAKLLYTVHQVNMTL